MINNTTYKEAVHIFLEHLKKINTNSFVLRRYQKLLKGTFKLLIVEELKYYPLSLEKINVLYSKHMLYRFNYALNKFNSMVCLAENLKFTTFGNIFRELSRHYHHLSKKTIQGIIQYLRKTVMIDVDDLLLSKIPPDFIIQCMKSKNRYRFIHGRRFFKFLINIDLLENSYLLHNPKVVQQLLEDYTNNQPSLEGKTLKIFVIYYLNHLNKTKKLSSDGLRSQYYHLKKFYDYIGENINIQTITHGNIRSYLDYLTNMHNYSKSSIKCILTTIRRFFRFLLTKKYITQNPSIKIKIKIPKSDFKSYIDENTLKSMLTNAYLNYKKYENININNSKRHLDKWLAARDWAIISILVSCGLRRKEIAALQIDNIDLNKRIIHINGKGNQYYYIKQREIPINEPIICAALETYLQLRPTTACYHLFINQRLEPLKESGFGHIIKQFRMKLSKNYPVTISQIRKAFANLCANSGIDPLFLKQIMGHSTLKTTMKYYLTVQEQKLKKIWEQNNSLLYFSEQEYTKWII
jgi:site-specific recombinase XerD